MRKDLFIALAFMGYFAQFSLADPISRIEIQNLFKQTPGNASYLPFWEKKYLNKPVIWEGTIFSLQYQQAFNRTEITMKVLPTTMMYDTIVYVPGNISDKFKPKQEVSFKGTIARGIDMLGVKEVQVSIGRNMDDRFGDFIFSNDGMVNVNFLQPEKTSNKQ